MFSAIQRLAELTARLNQIRPAAAVLIRNDPENTSAELVTVLQEVNKTFNAFESVLVTYLSLRFIPDTRDSDERQLVRLEGGRARLIVGEMRARCSKIGVLYHATLNPWFENAPIEASQQEALHALFLELEDSDANAIIPAVNELAEWLEREVDETSELVDAGRFDDAGDRVLAARRAVASVRRTIAQVSGELRDLEIQFTI